MRSTLSQIDRYELRSVLARTSTSIVYDGWDSQIARRVAIKTVTLASVDDDETREALIRFKRGVQAAGKLAHPNIVNIHDYGETDEYAYIVMEFIDGPTLKQLLDDGKRFDLPEVCRIIGAILDGLQYSHDHGVVHRDIKPANIMLTQAGNVKITDFGIARLEDNTMTQAGMIIGTPAYMSPEQFLGEEVDWRTDIYSMGVMLYHMLTGTRPYDGNMATIMNKVLNAPTPHLSGVPPSITPALDQIVSRATAKRREHRYRSAAEFNAVLQAVPRQPSTTAKPATPLHIDFQFSPRPPQRRASSHLPAVMGLTLLLAGMGAVGLRLTGFDWRAGIGAPHPTPPQDPASVAQPARDPPSEPARPPTATTTVTADIQTDDVTKNPSLPALDPPPSDKAALPQTNAAPPATTAERIPSAAPEKPDEPAVPVPPAKAPEIARPAKRSLPHRPDLEERPYRPGKASSSSRPPQPQAAASPEPMPPSPPYAVTSTSIVGLVCQTVTPDTAREVGLDGPRGMVVLGVTAGSAAAAAGIRSSDVLLKINGIEMQDLSGLRVLAAQLPPGQAVPVDVFRGGAVRTVRLQLDPLRH